MAGKMNPDARTSASGAVCRPETATGNANLARCNRTHHMLGTLDRDPARQRRSGRMNVPLDHREPADRYRGEIFRNNRLRVVLCRDGIQWILQREKWGLERAGGLCGTRQHGKP